MYNFSEVKHFNKHFENERNILEKNKTHTQILVMTQINSKGTIRLY